MQALKALPLLAEAVPLEERLAAVAAKLLQLLQQLQQQPFISAPAAAQARSLAQQKALLLLHLPDLPQQTLIQLQPLAFASVCLFFAAAAAAA